MLEKIKENIGVILIIALIGVVGTCNVRLRNNERAEIINNPQSGQYYVFDDYPVEGSESIMKIKEVKDKEIVFYQPLMKTIGDFKEDKTESTVREMDKLGRMYGSVTLMISKTDLNIMVENDGFSGHMNHKPRVIAVFK